MSTEKLVSSDDSKMLTCQGCLASNKIEPIAVLTPELTIFFMPDTIPAIRSAYVKRKNEEAKYSGQCGSQIGQSALPNFFGFIESLTTFAPGKNRISGVEISKR